MKMITAIINKKDSGKVCKVLTKSGFMFTKTATTGGFLSEGNTTLIMGVEDDQLDQALSLIRQNCSRRKELVAVLPHMESMQSFHGSQHIEVTVGGATVFVTDVSYFEKM